MAQLIQSSDQTSESINNLIQFLRGRAATAEDFNGILNVLRNSPQPKIVNNTNAVMTALINVFNQIEPTPEQGEKILATVLNQVQSATLETDDRFTPNQPELYEASIARISQASFTEEFEAKGDDPNADPEAQINLGETVIASLTDKTFGQDAISLIEATLDRDLTAEDLAIVRPLLQEGINEGLTPSEVANQATSTIGVRESGRTVKEQQEAFETLIGEKETQGIQEQESLRAFIEAGGVADSRALAALSAIPDPDTARLLATESIERQRLEELGIETRFEEERAGLGEELRGISASALEQVQPELEKRLQSLGILRSGERIKQTQEAEERLASERQRILATFGREDILQRRGLEFQFGQQAESLALQQAAGQRSSLDALFGLQAGVQREDILGGQQFTRGVQEFGLQSAFQSRENERQRQFEFQVEMARIQRANELAQLQKQQGQSSLFGALGGAASGALIGTKIFPGFGTLAGAGLGAIVGGLGASGGQSNVGGSIGSSLLLEGLRQKEAERERARRLGGSGSLFEPIPGHE